MWRSMKTNLKAMSGTSEELLPSHLSEFQWRSVREGCVFDNLLTDIANWYVV
jgi:hypothetical protein